MHLIFIANFFVIQSIHCTDHGVGRNHVGASIRDDIRVHYMCDVLQLTEDVKAFQYNEQAIMVEGASQSGIAYPVGGVQLL